MCDQKQTAVDNICRRVFYWNHFESDHFSWYIRSHNHYLENFFRSSLLFFFSTTCTIFIFMAYNILNNCASTEEKALEFLQRNLFVRITPPDCQEPLCFGSTTLVKTGKGEKRCFRCPSHIGQKVFFYLKTLTLKKANWVIRIFLNYYFHGVWSQCVWYVKSYWT